MIEGPPTERGGKEDAEMDCRRVPKCVRECCREDNASASIIGEAIVGRKRENRILDFPIWAIHEFENFR